MQQYLKLKEEYKDAILFFRLGDFYEMFHEQAEEVSSLLHLTLTKRNDTPMCGIPYHAKENYIARLLQHGKKVAICEQTTPPGQGKIVQREVVEVITPGTVVDDAFLRGNDGNYIAAISREGNTLSYAYVDISTGDFTISPSNWDSHGEAVRREIQRTAPKEILIDESLLETEPHLAHFLESKEGLLITKIVPWQFDIESSELRLQNLLGVQNLKAFQFTSGDPALKSVAPLLMYIESHAKNLLSYITKVQRREATQFLQMDESTQRNLELVRNLVDGGEKFTLFSLLKKTKTPMGSRLLQRWILNPLIDTEQITARQSAVSVLYNDQKLLHQCKDLLRGIHDLERLTTRVALGKIQPRELIKLKESALAALELDALLVEQLKFFPKTNEDTLKLRGITELLSVSLQESPTEGNIIQQTYSQELDTLKALRDNAEVILQQYVEREREKTGIPTVKLKQNRLIGYFLEIPKSSSGRAPERYIRKQSMAQAERFTTEQLMSIEVQVVEAKEKAWEMEQQIYQEILEEVTGAVEELFSIAERIAHYDLFFSLALCAITYGYTRPEVDNTNRITLKGGRHPVVEASLPPGTFVANNTEFQEQYQRFALITGPNMAGKSTYLRQTALIVLMAQMGSFVPAQSAKIGISDQIFCRVGATDNLTRGESTFLVEMNETAYILRNATARSLVIMDEVGRGTGTTDGLSIAWAVSEYLLKIGAKTLFATHFLELTQMNNPLIVLLHLLVTQEGDNITFLKQVSEGVAQGSYGIEVAKLAGVPQPVIRRAATLMKKLEEQQHAPHSVDNPLQHQLDLLQTDEPEETPEHLVAIEQLLEEQDLSQTTPIEALVLLEKLKKLIP